jgi:hypothetical protein
LARFAFADELAASVLLWHRTSILGVVMLLDPSGPRQKLNRALKHLDELDRTVNGFFNGPNKPYAFEAQPRENGAEVDVRIFILKEIPALDLGIIVGDVIHNLRSALDQLVWVLTVQNKGEIAGGPFEWNCWWRRVCFPTFSSVHSWKSGSKTPLAGIDPGLVPFFRQEQPFPAWEGGKPERQSLTLLHDLWNRDKHRSPSLSVANIRGYRETVGRNIGVLLAAAFGPYASPVPIQVLYQAPGEIEDGQIVVSLRMSHPVEAIHVPNLNLDAYGRLAIDVAFEQGPPAHGVPVRSTLRDMTHSVEEIVDRFEVFMGPKADYPVTQCPHHL